MNAPLKREPLPDQDDWSQRLIFGDRAGGARYPAWLDRSYASFREKVINPAYPCFFGTQAERRGEMFYTAVSPREPGALARPLETFVRLGRNPRHRRFNLAAFYEPIDQPASHEELNDWFWSELRALHAADRHHDAHGPFAQPDNPDWEFCYHGCQMFVVVTSPTYRQRRSRCLGPGIVLLFQPRAVFLDLITSKPIAVGVRDRIRQRLRAWDLTPPHPDLGLYGDPGNREWKQYCLPDDETPLLGACPFLTRQSAA